MIKKLTIEWLNRRNACSEGVEYFENQNETDPIGIIKKLIKTNEYEKLDWANWLIVRIMNKKQYVQYAIFAAESQVENFEKQFPEDDRPRRAIEAAKIYLKNPCGKTISAARSAESAAESAARSAWSAESVARFAARFAAWSAESAAWSAESAAESAARSAWSAESAAESAARSAARSAWSATRFARSAESAAESAAWSAESAALTEILKNGLKILEKKNDE